MLATERPLVLVLEDLHWRDTSTVDVLAYLGQRPEPAQLLVLGTYRPVDAMLRAHPLRRTVQELCGRGQALELHLEFLPAADVAAYVAGRCGGPVAPPGGVRPSAYGWQCAVHGERGRSRRRPAFGEDGDIKEQHGALDIPLDHVLPRAHREEVARISEELPDARGGEANIERPPGHLLPRRQAERSKARVGGAALAAGIKPEGNVEALSVSAVVAKRHFIAVVAIEISQVRRRAHRLDKAPQHHARLAHHGELLEGGIIRGPPGRRGSTTAPAAGRSPGGRRAGRPPRAPGRAQAGAVVLQHRPTVAGSWMAARNSA